MFFAKLVQRVGGWPIPTAIPNKDFDGRQWANRAEKLKAMGYRKNGGEDSDSFESEAEFTSRVAGIMRIYFSILKIAPRQALKPMFQSPRYWTWFARLLGERSLLESPVAAQVMYSKYHRFYVSSFLVLIVYFLQRRWTSWVTMLCKSGAHNG